MHTRASSAKLLGEAELVVDFSTPSPTTSYYEGRCVVGYTRVGYNRGGLLDKRHVYHRCVLDRGGVLDKRHVYHRCVLDRGMHTRASSAKLLGEAELVVDFSTPSPTTTSYEGKYLLSRHTTYIRTYMYATPAVGQAAS